MRLFANHRTLAIICPSPISHNPSSECRVLQNKEGEVRKDLPSCFRIIFDRSERSARPCAIRINSTNCDSDGRRGHRREPGMRCRISNINARAIDSRHRLDHAHWLGRSWLGHWSSRHSGRSRSCHWGRHRSCHCSCRSTGRRQERSKWRREAQQEETVPLQPPPCLWNNPPPPRRR